MGGWHLAPRRDRRRHPGRPAPPPEGGAVLLEGDGRGRARLGARDRHRAGGRRHRGRPSGETDRLLPRLRMPRRRHGLALCRSCRRGRPPAGPLRRRVGVGAARRAAALEAPPPLRRVPDPRVLRLVRGRPVRRGLLPARRHPRPRVVGQPVGGARHRPGLPLRPRLHAAHAVGERAPAGTRSPGTGAHSLRSAATRARRTCAAAAGRSSSRPRTRTGCRRRPAAPRPPARWPARGGGATRTSPGPA